MPDADHSVHRGRWAGPDIWRAYGAGPRHRGSNGRTETPPHRVVRGVRRREIARAASGSLAAQGRRTPRWTPSTTTSCRSRGLPRPRLAAASDLCNVAFRARSSICYACVRAGPLLRGVPSPVKAPELVDMVIFRENTEDIYAGIRLREPDRRKPRSSSTFCTTTRREPAFGSPGTAGVGIKPICRDGRQAPSPGGASTMRCRTIGGRYAGTQRQHHEVHGGRVPRLGLCRGHVKSTARRIPG